MGRLVGSYAWAGAGLFLAAACTAVANGRLSDKPSEAEMSSGGGGASTTSDGPSTGSVPTTSTTGGGAGGDGEGGSVNPPKSPLGSGCDGPDDCASGHCAPPGICCESACVGECKTCNKIGLEGVCVARVGLGCTSPVDGLCTSEGICGPKAGGNCNSPANCASGFCVDGVCCIEDCDGVCEGCSGPSGVCQAAPESGNECGGMGCVDQGQCCGSAPAPTGSGCPPACTSCNNGTCTIQCIGEEACLGDNIVCPPGFDCEIECVGKHACRDAAIDCPADLNCDLNCDNTASGDHACEASTLKCTNGPCSSTCVGNKPCKDAIVNCGSNACSVSCINQGSDYPTVNGCGAACACTNTCP